MNDKNKTLLIILDGWGIGNGSESDLITNGDTPYYKSLLENYPHSQLIASGEDVGLPEGQMGNSEVGHLNIGAGRVVYQDLVRINKAVRENTIAQNQPLIDAFSYARDNNKSVHFIGLVSDGGVHSMDTHLYKLCDITKDYNLEKVYIHALTDGRDVDPKSGYGFVKNLEEHLKTSNGAIATLIGRYYTMDRDKRWDRVKIGYDLMVEGKGKPVKHILNAIEESYIDGVTDEFIKPIVKVDDLGNPIGRIQNGDVVICFNYRTDRLRQISIALTQTDFPEFGMKALDLQYYTMTRYDDAFKNVHVIYDKQNIEMTMGEVVSKAGKNNCVLPKQKNMHMLLFSFLEGEKNPTQMKAVF